MSLKNFRASARSFHDNKLVEPGEIAQFDTSRIKPGKTWEAVDADDAKKAPTRRELSMQDNNKAPNGPRAELASPLPTQPLA